jgi:antimicrobial peptide system SdpB family protein
MQAPPFLISASNDFFAKSYFSRTYAIGRSLIGLSVLLTFMFNGTDVLFGSMNPSEIVPYCPDNSINLFCLFKSKIWLAKLISIFILVLVVIGWRPQITGILHWWVLYSFMSSTPIIDGGEHAATVITLLLIPVTLFDNRKWHWAKVDDTHVTGPVKLTKRFVQLLFFQIARLQVALIYLHAAVGKSRVLEWVDGTATYYWLVDPVYGLSSGFRSVVAPLLSNAYIVVVVSWGVIILELMLFVGFFLTRRKKLILLFLGIVFHFLIAIFHGLISFSLVMIGALVVLLYEEKNA